MSTTISHVSRTVARPLTRLAAALLVAGVCSGSLHAQQLLAPTATVASFSQGYLSAQLMQWGFSFASAVNPLLDTTGANSALGDQGKYFFLASSLSSDPVVRSVTVRTDQTLVFSPTTSIYWTTPGEAVNTEAGMRAELVDVFGDVSNLSVTLGGVPVALPVGYTSLDQFRQSSPLFPLNLAPGAILSDFGFATGSFPAVSLGITYALQGLTEGVHQLRFTSTNQSTGPYAGFPPSSYDITYNITAVPEASTWAMMSLGMLGIAGTSLRRRRMQALDQRGDELRA